jgi:hypothetical protein
VAQVVDGQWAIQGNTVRTLQTGYDRLLAIGDAPTWKDYDVTSNVTIHSMDPTGGAVGIVVGWQGHTTNQYGLNLPDQPRTGHPFPAFFNFSGLNSGRLDLNIFSNNNSAADNERFLAVDNSGMTLMAGVTYTFKGEVTENSATSSHFKFKVWPVGTPEPAAWLLETDGAHSQGSILLGAHQADASFGTTTITALP